MGESTPLVGAILAGGRAQRMGGRAKGLELVGGERIAERVLAALRAVTRRVVVAGGDPDLAHILGAEFVDDARPGNGPLGGIVGALRATGADVLAIAWDMPWVTPDALRPLLEAGPELDGAAWTTGGELEPLCTLYRRSALAPLSEALDRGERRARVAASGLRLQLLDASVLPPGSLASVNTPAELEAARERAATTALLVR
ncbi:MAG TPA: molybdenum cofactor guanylyltransferase [Gemmatimonadaceae bacterium]|nr:molybdenum cofactor guanylyltransferase [Gemmatimonadaceae bacterium]